MSATPVPRKSFAEFARREILQLQALAVEAKARLEKLNQDVVDAEHHLNSLQSVQLVEANEQLVLAAMRYQGDADAASQALEQVSSRVHRDPLTGLADRVMLLDRLEHATLNAKRHGAPLALLFLDLNHFKQINDTLGHAIGDEVLKLVATRLSDAVREGDTVSRLGGDEFVLLLTQVAYPSDAVLVAEKLITALAAPSEFQGHFLHLTASIGISLYPDDGETAAALLEHADAAMYRAKRRGLGSVVRHAEENVAEQPVNPFSLASLRRSVTPLDRVIADEERLNGQLREANQQLVLSAVSAQDLHSAAQAAHLRLTSSLARVAHELRGPLGPIRSAAAVMARPQSGEAAQRGTHVLIERQLTHLSSLIDDLLDLSGVDAGALQIQPRLVDVVDVIDAAVELCRPAMDARLQSLAVRTPAAAVKMQADPRRLSQVFINLLDNASKFTPERGEITLTVDRGDRLLTVTVSDNGIGIPAELLSSVFEPFVQEPRALEINGCGLGVGLTVVRELVEAHGGHVIAVSPGRDLGSQFVVTLPC